MHLKGDASRANSIIGESRSIVHCRVTEANDPLDVFRNSDKKIKIEESSKKMNFGEELTYYVDLEISEINYKKNNPLEFWKQLKSKLPMLSTVAKSLLCMPASTGQS